MSPGHAPTYTCNQTAQYSRTYALQPLTSLNLSFSKVGTIIQPHWNVVFSSLCNCQPISYFLFSIGSFVKLQSCGDSSPVLPCGFPNSKDHMEPSQLSRILASSLPVVDRHHISFFFF